VEKLLSNTEGAIPVTVPAKEFSSMTWSQFEIEIKQAAREKKMAINLFALIHDGEPNVCPDCNQVIRIDDSIILIVRDRGFNWRKFSKKMSRA